MGKVGIGGRSRLLTERSTNPPRYRNRIRPATLCLAFPIEWTYLARGVSENSGGCPLADASGYHGPWATRQ